MTYFTLDEINDVIETVEDFLKEYNVRIPESDKEMEENNGELDENDALIYGTVYDNLQGKLLDLFEKLEKENKVANVVNSWQSEVDTWEE